MKKEELLKELESLAWLDDTEMAHRDADDLLLKFIDDKEVKEAFDKIHKWYA